MVMPNHYSVLFVCLGNICRSPLAEGIFRHLVNEQGLSSNYTIDSCGTGSWHIGEPPHKDSRRVAKKNGVSLDGQQARTVASDDIVLFDLLVAMDTQNKIDLESKFGTSEKIILLREYDSKRDTLDVPDPYFGGPEGFDLVYDMISRSCRALLSDLNSR